MTVYFGEQGQLQIKRKSSEAIRGPLDPSDVSVEKRRFSVGNNDIQGELLTGDQVDITRKDGGNLQLVSGHNYPDWRGYVFVDQLGGIRLFKTFDQALSGSIEAAVILITPTENQDIEIKTRGSNYNNLGQIVNYEFTTERDTINITNLGDQFKKQYDAGLITGQGQINCFFEYRSELCDPSGCDSGVEFSIYLSQLCIRLVQGADFFGRFFIYTPSSDDSLDVTGDEQSVWYDAECIVTNSTINVAATKAIESTINFVTTGQIRLSTGIPPASLLQEDSALILQEDGVSKLELAGQDV